MDKMDGLSLDLEKQNIEKIKELFPEAVEEGKINFEVLRAFLGDEVDDSREKYQFTWNGKANSIKIAQTPSSATLRPCKDKSKNWDTTENLYIEGDNLEVLKLLQKTYYGKIKMIYIDPPYNTGNDFVYKDSFSNSIENYKEQTNQKCSKIESTGRIHTEWLNMMNSRIILAKNLLSETGVLFISINDNEQENLKKICVENFGEANYVATLVRKTKTTSNNGNQFAPAHEYILVCAKNISLLNGFNDSEAQESEDYQKLFKNEDDYGKYNVIGLYQPALKHGGSTYPIECPDGTFVITPEGKPWRWNENTFLKNKEDNRVVFKETKTSPLLDLNGKQSKWNIYTKLYLKDRLESGMRPITFIDKYPNSEASKELLKMDIPFDFSKPRRLMQYLMKICGADDESIILDFFSGSATTAHAVMKLNVEDGGNRKFIMVQLPEVCDEKSEAYKAGYKNICEIGEERIRRAGEQIKDDWEKEHPSDSLFSSNEKFNVDIGFKVFKLDSTNIVPWDSSEQYNEDNLFNLNDVFKIDRSNEDVLYEIMLKYGVFDKEVEEIDVNGKIMYRVGKRYMIVCLEDNVTSDDVKAIGELSPKTVIFKEKGFADDNAKINAVYNLEKAGVEDIKCI